MRVKRWSAWNFSWGAVLSSGLSFRFCAPCSDTSKCRLLSRNCRLSNPGSATECAPCMIPRLEPLFGLVFLWEGREKTSVVCDSNSGQGAKEKWRISSGLETLASEKKKLCPTRNCIKLQPLLGLIHTGRATRRAHKCFSFDVACQQCEHSHWQQQVPFAGVTRAHPVLIRP